MKKYIALLIFVNISVFGSALTNFSFGIWLLKNIDETYLFTLISFFGMAPGILLAPTIGKFVDKWNKKRVIIVGQICSACISLVVIYLYSINVLEPWHIMISAFVGAICGSFTSQAFYVVAINLVSTKDLIRVGGFSQATTSFLNLGIPILSPILFNMIGLEGVFVIDLVTFVLFISALSTMTLIIKSDAQKVVTENLNKQQKKELKAQEKKEVWNFFISHKGYMWYLGYMFIINFFFAISQSLFGPMIMDFSDESSYAMVSFSSSVGMIIGGLLIGMNRGNIYQPVRKMIIGTAIMGSVFCCYFLPVSVYLMMGVVFGVAILSSFLGSFNNVLWQVTVPHNMHARVLGYRSLIAGLAFPLAFLLSGFIVDLGVIPILKNFPNIIDYFTGTVKSSAIAIIYIFSGIMILLIGLIASRMSLFKDFDQLYLSKLKEKESLEKEAKEKETILERELEPAME